VPYRPLAGGGVNSLRPTRPSLFGSELNVAEPCILPLQDAAGVSPPLPRSCRLIAFVQLCRPQRSTTMAKPAPPSKKGEHAKRNAAHKKRRAARDLPKTNKKTAKNRLRDAERWLRRLETNCADQEQITNAQKAVEELRSEKASDEVQRKRIDKEKRYAERYRKVKFFEKRKVLRRLKRLKREMASSSPPSDGKERLEALEGDLAYVSFYPKDRKYVGLFTVRGAEDARTAKRRAEARKLALAAAAAAASASSSSSSDDESDGEDAFADAGEASDGEASGDFFLAA